MGENSNNQIFVVTSMEEESGRKPVERGLGDALKKSAIKAVDVSALKDNMERFFNQLREILATGKDKIGEFEIDEVEVSAQITAGGEVCLMGSGVKIGAGGGVKFVLKRGKQS